MLTERKCDLDKYLAITATITTFTCIIGYFIYLAINKS